MRKIFAISAVLTAFPCAVTADWQYTKWGMTVDEVIAASNGTATKRPEEELALVLRNKPEGMVALATAPFRAGQYTFKAVFLLGWPDQKLREVRLDSIPLDRSVDWRTIRSLLMDRYGEPDVSMGNDAIWMEKENNNILFVGYRDMVWITYSDPVFDAERAGRQRELDDEAKERL